MKANELFPSPHIEAADLEGKDVVVTIARVSKALVGAEKVEKGVMFFEEFKRGFVLNRTNGGRIVAIYGNDTDLWTGKKLTLYPSEATFNGKVVPCIRVREKAPEAK